MAEAHATLITHCRKNIALPPQALIAPYATLAATKPTP